MSGFFLAILARIRGFLRPGDLASDFDQELAAHLAMAEEDGVRRGLSPEEARRVARVRLGGVAQLREARRAASGLPWLDCLALDARLGLRMLRRSWGLTVAAGLAMTLVITVAAAAFVFLDQFMGRTAPPLDEGDRVVAIQSWDGEARRRRETSRRDLERWNETLRSVEDLGGFETVERRLVIGSGPAEWVRVAEISAAGFRLARVPPQLGRWIAEADAEAAAPPVLVIGHEVWRSRFAADPGVVGETVRLGELAHTVVGVMPAGFGFPVNHGYWTAARPDPSGTIAAAPEGAIFARLAPGVSLERAQAELSAVGLLPPTSGAMDADPRRPRVVPYTFAFTDDVERGELAWRQRLVLLLVTLLLVPPCLNIAILVYARTVSRQEELAARFALGASRSRIVAQLCVEVLVLAAAAGVLALALVGPILARVGEVIRRLPELGGSLPFWIDLRVSWRAALFVAGLCVLAALIAGLVPALQATGRAVPLALRSLGSRAGIPLGRTWTALILAQVGLALAVLPSTVELAWGNLRPAVLGPGFAAGELLTARLEVDPAALAARGRDLGTDAIARIEAELGPSAVTFAAALPGAEPMTLVEVEDGSAGEGHVRAYVRANQVDRAFFGVLGVSALAGRTFAAGDFGSAVAAVVDRTFAQQLVAGGTAVGRRVRPVPEAGEEPGPWYEIVGIVPDRPANTSQGRLYVPQRQGAARLDDPVHLVFRAGVAPGQTSRRLQELATSLDPALRLGDVRRLDEVYGERQMVSNLTSYVLVLVATSVLILSAVGLYALMSFTVARQRREIGIRTALGAPPGRLLASVFASALRQLAAGVLVGAALAFVLHRRLDIEVEGGWHIPGILPAAAAFIVVVGLAAAAGPARRAIGVAPTEALREG